MITTVYSESANLRRGVQHQPEMIRDSNPDLRINPDVCRIAPKMLWILYFIGVIHFAKCHENQPVTV